MTPRSSRPRRILGPTHALHLAALLAWRHFPWPGGRGRTAAKKRLARALADYPPRPVPTEAGWLSLAWGDDLLERSLFAGGRHDETGVVRFLRRLDLAGRCVLDVGAHVGFYAVLLARAVGPSGRVVAFEPQPRRADAVERALALNGCDWARVVRAATTDRAGEVTLRRPADTGRSSIGDLARGLVEEEALRVPAVRLDTWCAEHLDAPVDWIKMDIEGAEWLALDGIEGLGAPNLLVEVHPAPIAAFGGRVEVLVERLAAKGYRLFRLDEEGEPRPLVDRRPEALGAQSTWHLLARPAEVGA